MAETAWRGWGAVGRHEGKREGDGSSSKQAWDYGEETTGAKGLPRYCARESNKEWNWQWGPCVSETGPALRCDIWQEVQVLSVVQRKPRWRTTACPALSLSTTATHSWEVLSSFRFLYFWDRAPDHICCWHFKPRRIKSCLITLFYLDYNFTLPVPTCSSDLQILIIVLIIALLRASFNHCTFFSKCTLTQVLALWEKGTTKPGLPLTLKEHSRWGWQVFSCPAMPQCPNTSSKEASKKAHDLACMLPVTSLWQSIQQWKTPRVLEECVIRTGF